MLEANSQLEVEGCLPGYTWVKESIMHDFQGYKRIVTKHLETAIGKIHISFDLWTSRNQLALCGIIVHFINSSGKPFNFLLSLPEILRRHTGENIADIVIGIVTEFNLQDRIGYIITDNATTNDIAIDLLSSKLGFNMKERRLRCMGHVINLIVRAILFGKDVSALQCELEQPKNALGELQIWRRLGPIGKLHNIVKYILASPQRRRRFEEVQKLDDIKILVEAFIDGRSMAKTWLPVRDNETRWNSTYNMIVRAIELRQAIERFLDDELIAWEGRELVRAHRRKRGAINANSSSPGSSGTDDFSSNDVSAVETFT